MNIEKLKMLSTNIVGSNVEKISKVFPNCITEAIDKNGTLKKVIDFDLLKQELSDDLVEGTTERYSFGWVGKSQCMLEANRPINKTLRPCKETSINFDTTQNLMIEGDNLEVLKLLQSNYLNKIKMIYIDPPYNTGNDFIYKDNFTQNQDEYLQQSGQKDKEGNALTANKQSNGRFHSDWLSMMYPRLKLARNLLTDDGVIFISIDDNEVANLRKIGNEIFGEDNFIGCFIWQKTYSPKNNNKYVSTDHDYIICYTRNINNIKEFNRLNRTSKNDLSYKYDDNDGKGKYRLDNLTIGELKGYDIKCNGKVYKEPATRGWRYTESKMYELIKKNLIYLPDDENKRPAFKRYLSEVKGIISKTILLHDIVSHSDEAKKSLDKLIGINIFNYPKPVKLINYFLHLITDQNSIILDFFAGSGTTAHAVMELNAQDNGKRKFIMVQIPETCKFDTQAFQAGFKTIADITKERIRRAGNKILSSANLLNINDIDIGFRVLKVDSSNMKDVYYTPDEQNQNDLLDQISYIKEVRTPDDLLFQVMLDWGLELSLPFKQKQINQKQIYIVSNKLVACFDEIDSQIIDEVAKIKPQYFTFVEQNIKNDNDKTNFKQRLKQLSPEVQVKII